MIENTEANHKKPRGRPSQREPGSNYEDLIKDVQECRDGLTEEVLLKSRDVLLAIGPPNVYNLIPMIS